MTNNNHTPEITVTEASLLRRVAVFLEDGEFERADEYCERVLDMNVENGEAYFFKLLAGLRLRDKSELYSLEKPFDTEPAYSKIMRFADEDLRKEAEEINLSIIKRAEERTRTLLFENALELSQEESIPSLTQAYSIFSSLEKTEDALQCQSKIEALYDFSYNELYLSAESKEQEIKDSHLADTTDTMEKEDYDRYITENRNKRVFDYSLIVAAVIVVAGITAIILSVNSLLSLSGISLKTVLRCIFTKIIPGIPLTGIGALIGFRASKSLVKKQRANLIEDIGTATQRSKEISEKISSAKEESFRLKRELDEILDALKELNNEYDAFLAEKEKKEEADKEEAKA